MLCANHLHMVIKQTTFRKFQQLLSYIQLPKKKIKSNLNFSPLLDNQDEAKEKNTPFESSCGGRRNHSESDFSVCVFSDQLHYYPCTVTHAAPNVSH